MLCKNLRNFKKVLKYLKVHALDCFIADSDFPVDHHVNKKDFVVLTYICNSEIHFLLCVANIPWFITVFFISFLTGIIAQALDIFSTLFFSEQDETSVETTWVEYLYTKQKVSQ